MALPIRETPVLYGEDARRFAEAARRAEAGLDAVSPEEYKRAVATYEACKKAWGEDMLRDMANP